MDAIAAVAVRADQLVEAGEVLDGFNLLLTGRELARETLGDGEYERWQAAVEAFAREHGIRLH